MQPLAWLGVYVIELLFMALPISVKFKKLVSIPLTAAVLLSCFWLYDIGAGAWLLVILPSMIFRVINVLRVTKARMHPEYLRRATARTSVALAVMTSLALASLFAVSLQSYLQLMPILQCFMALGLLIVTAKNIRKLQFKMPKSYLVDRELPTVTVAIPAKNESRDLLECLDTVLASDYPKLEIIVIDETSHGTTAQTIKDYAHDGVRFIQGGEPKERWLAKNQAYEKLYQEASGELILFCGVDVRFDRRTIRNMVNVLRHRNKAMLSVLPKRIHSSPAALFIQPMRYWWELSLPRRLFNRPPVLSTCWLIGRKKLKKLGGFAAVSHSIMPEGYFARELIKTDEYAFIRSSNDLQVHTVKSLSAQRSTAVRTQYPKIRRRPEMALALTVFNLVFLIGPFVGLLAGFWIDDINQWLCAAAAVMLIATHVHVIAVSDPSNTLEAVLTFPVAVIIETVIGYVSMIQYEFFTVTWKERSIITPVMHVIPKEHFLKQVSNM